MAYKDNILMFSKLISIVVNNIESLESISNKDYVNLNLNINGKVTIDLMFPTENIKEILIQNIKDLKLQINTLKIDL